MDSWHQALQRASAAVPDVFRPEFFRLSRPEDRANLEDLLKREHRITVHDQLHAQLRELVKALCPSANWTEERLDETAQAHLNGIEPAQYGVWVYYPWSYRLVHLLDEPEFAQVRTDRNRNKITREEQAVLASKRIGVIGLSVGQSAALTLALERGFGELRIADFDTLDLSNLNRIRSGIHHLGVAKTVNVAREIAELDPFLRVTCYNEGITKANIEAFLTDGGPLDLLIEECDSVDIKILARQHAKAHRIPVVMDTSDRGLIDVERFDLEPDRPLLHGLLEGLDLSLVERPMTNQEKLPFMGRIVGMETISERMRASLPELGKTISTWPQLASGVVLGGALVTDVCRRILLGEFQSSGRWWVDMETAISSDSLATSDHSQSHSA